MTKLERLIKANELIHLIATTGRKFFNSEDKNGFISKFEMKNGRTYFVDGYTKSQYMLMIIITSIENFHRVELCRR